MNFYGTTFTFNGVSCEDFDLMLYDTGDTSGDDVVFAGSGTPVEEEMMLRWKPLFYGVQFEDKLTFKLTFGVNECRLDEERWLTREELNRIATWLTGHHEYCWLEIDQDDMNDVRYKCMVTSLQASSHIGHPFSLQAEFTCDGPYAYRYPKEKSYEVNGTATIKVNNESCLHGFYYPVVRFANESGGGLSIENTTDGNRTLIIGDIPNSVNLLTIDNDRCVITNDQSLNLYGNCSFEWLRLKPGVNELLVTGTGTITFVYEFPVNVGG